MLAFFSSFFLTYIFIDGNTSISIYIMCVILCLFSALSRRVGALQFPLLLVLVLFTAQFKQGKSNCIQYSQNARVCVCACVRVCVLRIVSPDKILCNVNAFSIMN